MYRNLKEMAKIPILLLGLWLLGSWAVVSEAKYIKLKWAEEESTDPKYIKYKDPKQPIEARVEDLVSRMTLEEKVGQMLQTERKVATPQSVNKYFIGEYHAIP